MKRSSSRPFILAALAANLVSCAAEQPREASQAPQAVATVKKSYMRGLTADYLTGELQKRGLECQEPRRQDNRLSWLCTLLAGTGVNYRVEFLGDSPSQIEYVTATVTQAGPPQDAPLIQFLGFVAASKYEGSDPSKAHEWTDQKIRDNDEIVIGGVKLRLSGPRGARNLSMFPIGSEWE
jgi:hypothetical protein